MIKIKEPMKGALCRTIAVDGFSDYANPTRVRISIYSINMGMPEQEDEDTVLQLVRESELVFSRDVFIKFAERIAKLKKWMEKHPIENNEMDRQEMQEYIAKNFTSNEILAIWIGHELDPLEVSTFGLNPHLSKEGDK